MRQLFRRSLLLTLSGIISLSMVASIVTSHNAYAADPDLKDRVEKWFLYRGMRACLTQGLSGHTLSAEDVNAGLWKPSGTDSAGIRFVDSNKKGFGYLALGMDGGNDNDGTVACDDGNVFYDGAEAFGFENAVGLFCEINRSLSELGEGDYITPDSDSDCEKSSEFATRANGGDAWQQALTDALDTTGERPKYNLDDNPNPGAMKYYIGKISLEQFCGGGKALSDGIDDLSNNESRVKVDIVNPDGSIEDNVTYKLANGMIDTKKVDDVIYFSGDGDDASDYTCAKMAELTRNHSKDYQIWTRANREAADQNKEDAESGANGDGADGNTKPTCNIDGIGWIVCPAMTFLASINDYAFEFISDKFLEIDAAELEGNQYLLEAWETFRNIANVAFIIAFLIMIYSIMVGRD